MKMNRMATFDDYICVGISDKEPTWATVDDVEKVTLDYLESLPGHWEFVCDKDDE